MTNNKIIAITGGSGFIGKLLLENQLAQKHEVRILSRNKKLDSVGIKHFQGDLTLSSDEKVLTEFTRGVDILYHCAGELYDKSQMEALHVSGTKRLIDSSKGQIKRWVQLSSVGAYGPCRTGIIENLSTENPKGIYEITKSKSDQLVKKSGLDFVILRPSIVFGSSMPNRSLLELTEIIRRKLFFFIGHHAVVNYIHVIDVVKAMQLCGERPEALYKTFILSDTITLEQMVKALSDGMGVESPNLRFPELLIRILVKIFGRFKVFPLTKSRLDALTNHCRYDSSAIKMELGFSFNLRLNEALKLYAKSIS